MRKQPLKRVSVPQPPPFPWLKYCALPLRGVLNVSKFTPTSIYRFDENQVCSWKKYEFLFYKIDNDQKTTRTSKTQKKQISDPCRQTKEISIVYII